MRFITEEELRTLYAKAAFSELFLEENERLTPGARQFLIDFRIPFAHKKTRGRDRTGSKFPSSTASSVVLEKTRQLEIELMLLSLGSSSKVGRALRTCADYLRQGLAGDLDEVVDLSCLDQDIERDLGKLNLAHKSAGDVLRLLKAGSLIKGLDLEVSHECTESDQDMACDDPLRRALGACAFLLQETLEDMEGDSLWA